jgi:hypothetical protein
MAQSFEASSPVLYFRPKAHTHPGPRNQRAWLLWPVWVYRVVAPDVSDRKLNVFEEAILGMLHSGAESLQDIADSLSLDPELTAYIAKHELVERGFLDDSTLRPTPYGVQHLQGQVARSVRKTVGFVFQDPWTLQLWPVFRDRLEFIELEYGDNGFPDLILGGTKGRPWRQHAHCLIPWGAPAATRPPAEDVLKAVRAETRMRARSRNSLYVDEDDDVVERLDQQFGTFRQVSFVDDQPEPHFAVTYMYTPHDGSGDAEWYACDPFGGGYSMSFKREVSARVSKNSSLANFVSGALGIKKDSDAALPLGHERAEAAISARYDASDIPIVIRKELVEFQHKLYQIETAQLRHSGTEQSFREAYTQARRVLEAVMLHINDRYRDAGVWRVLYIHDRPKENGELRDITMKINRKAAQEAGFATASAPRIFGTGAITLRKAAERLARGSLAAEIMLSIHVAVRQPDHPFRLAAKTHPALVEQLERFLQLVHPAAHFTESLECSAEEIGDLVFTVCDRLHVPLGVKEPSDV